MTKNTNLLIEIGIEELPTKAVTNLSEAGKDLWGQAFKDAAITHGKITAYGSPRRLAWHIENLSLKQNDQSIKRKGPALKAAKDAEGNWTKAALGFAQSCGVDIDAISIEETPKGAWLMYYGTAYGKETQQLFPDLFASIMHKLPIAKRMRWSDFDEPFVRPVNSLIVLADDQIWPLNYFGIESSNQSLGHRVHHPQSVTISHANDYAPTLKKAYVICAQSEREQLIREQVQAHASALHAKAVMPEVLITENASLTEWPIAITGNFEEKFLEVPQEVLITTLQDNQKSFAVIDDNGKMRPHFIAISNLESKDPQSVSKGNERVIRPRFADAEFFWQQDLKSKLANYLPALEKVVYQKKLGSIAEKTRRMAKIAAVISDATQADKAKVAHAAKLSKADLQTEMVMEFPELQGVMGRNYAQREGIDTEIAAALEEQYFPLGAGGALPNTKTGLTIALAEKIDTLVGGFAIGAKPTGSKDPYALRRMSISLIRLIVENQLRLPLANILKISADCFDSGLNADKHINDIQEYIIERLQGYYKDQNIDINVYQAVAAIANDDLLDFDQRIKALQAFSTSAQAEGLLASAKRIRNILKKNGETQATISEQLLIEDAEKNLYQTWQKISQIFEQAINESDYLRCLETLNQLAQPLADFFENVMVMTDDEALKNNRLALLSLLQRQFNKIADLALLGN